MCTACDWKSSLQKGQDMIESGSYEWSDALPGIVEFIEENEHVTPNQRAALAKIAASPRDDD